MWRRAHRSLLDRVARDLARDPALMLTRSSTGVVAHGQPRFANMLQGCLNDVGITVACCSVNGPDALGVVVAEQPSVLFVGEGLEMMTGPDLLREAARYAPRTVLAACTVPGRQQAMFDAGAHTVFLPGQPAEAVVWWLRYALRDHPSDHMGTVRGGGARVPA